MVLIKIIIPALVKALSLKARTEMALLYLQFFLETAALTSPEVTQLHYNKNQYYNLYLPHFA